MTLVLLYICGQFIFYANFMKIINILVVLYGFVI